LFSKKNLVITFNTTPLKFGRAKNVQN